MKSNTYHDILREYEIESNSQLTNEIIFELEEIIDNDLYQGKNEDAKEKIIKLSQDQIKNSTKEIVCLACTELPLAFPEYQDSPCFTIEGITFINTTVAHVEAILETALE